MWREFREFAMRGNVVDLAVGIILGAAFTTIVNSLVNDIIMPPIGLAIGGIDFSNLFVTLKGGSYPTLEAAKAAGASWKGRPPGNLAPRPGQNLRIHHDNGESISDLAVSLSLGDRCSFRLSNTGNHGYPCTDLTLSSGDTLVFGRQARFACHDEPRIYPGTGHPGSGLTRGRINITMRITVPGGQ